MILRRWVRIPILSCLLLVFATASFAASYKVSRVVYKNHGAYKARVYLRWNDGSRKCAATIGTFDGGVLSSGEYGTISLNEKDSFKYPDATDEAACELTSGTEVWAKIEIVLGDTQSCRKDATKFYYNANGGTVTYMSEGTTLNNNRCKIDATPGETNVIND